MRPSGKFTFAEGENGKAVNEEKLKNDIVARTAAGEYDAVITAEVEETAPEITAAQAGKISRSWVHILPPPLPIRTGMKTSVWLQLP